MFEHHVNAKFWVRSVERQTVSQGQLQRRVVLAPSLQGEDNKDWAKYTPSGTIELNINGPAGEWFEQMQAEGKDVRIKFGVEVEGSQDNAAS